MGDRVVHGDSTRWLFGIAKTIYVARGRATDGLLVLGTALVASVLAGCGGGSASGPFPNDHNAITILASSADTVELVAATGTVSNRGETVITFDPVKVLQPNYNKLFDEGMDTRFPTDAGFAPGHDYVIFLSYSRGGSCLSAAFEKAGNHLQLLPHAAHFSPDAPRGFQLSHRFITMPTSLTYSTLFSDLFPTGGELDASNTAESWCPGP